RADIPVGVGMEFDAKSKEAQAEWVEGYDLEKYPGKVYRDGVQAIIDTIMQSPEPITLIAVGPLPNIAEAFRREPRIAEKARFVGMHGALRVGYRRSPKVAAEWNVRAAPAACAAAFAAPWEVTITPLDTCDQVQLDGELYQKVLASRDPIAQMIVENYRIWAKSHPTNDPTVRSSVLFDTVAVYLGFSEELLKMETLGVRVTDEGMTVIDPEAKKLRAATAWKDLDAFESLLVRTITGE
ncbi:MAG: nucleoside hydrolase, partial [Planctomycetota bacterium]